VHTHTYTHARARARKNAREIVYLLYIKRVNRKEEKDEIETGRKKESKNPNCANFILHILDNVNADDIMTSMTHNSKSSS